MNDSIPDSNSDAILAEMREMEDRTSAKMRVLNGELADVRKNGVPRAGVDWKLVLTFVSCGILLASTFAGIGKMYVDGFEKNRVTETKALSEKMDALSLTAAKQAESAEKELAYRRAFIDETKDSNAKNRAQIERVMSDVEGILGSRWSRDMALLQQEVNTERYKTVLTRQEFTDRQVEKILSILEGRAEK